LADDLGERTEEPTQRKLSDARGKGQVPKSQDLSSAVMLIGAVALLVVLGGGVLSSLAQITRRVLAFETPGEVADPASASTAFAWAMIEGGIIVLPLMGVLFVLAAISNVGQTGLMVSLDPVRPKLDKLNPVSGVKKLFGLRNVVKTGVNLGKLIVVLAVSVVVIQANLVEIVALPSLSMLAGLYGMGRIILELLAWLLLLLLVLAVIDLIYQRWQHKKDLRMTKQEVKDERRSMEGDPEVKKRRFQMAQQIAVQRIQSSVPNADVVVTNPTHFAVALRYDTDTMAAPRVVAKGVDYMALRIRQVAAAHRVTIVERPPLARALYWGVEVGREVPPEHYEAVAEILAYVYKLEGKTVAA